MAGPQGCILYVPGMKLKAEVRWDETEQCL